MRTSIEDSYERLIALLDQYGVQYRLIDHAPEGRTELVSAMRMSYTEVQSGTNLLKIEVRNGAIC